MTATLTCPQIKEMYEALYSETAAVYEKLLVVDTKVELEVIEPLIVQIHRKYFTLLDYTGNEEINKVRIRAVNPDIAEIFEKDTNGFRCVTNKDGEMILYNPMTGERSEEFIGIGECDTNGFWCVKNRSGKTILYNPMTRESNEEFKYIGRLDQTNGFWEVTTMDGKTMKYNPLTKEYLL